MQISLSLDDLVRKSIVTLGDELPGIVFSSSLRTEVYVLDYDSRNDKNS